MLSGNNLLKNTSKQQLQKQQGGNKVGTPLPHNKNKLTGVRTSAIGIQSQKEFLQHWHIKKKKKEEEGGTVSMKSSSLFGRELRRGEIRSARNVSNEEGGTEGQAMCVCLKE